jgi:Flp pilus assembly pilin Flp
MHTIQRFSTRFARAARLFWRRDEAIAVTEYGLLIALVAILLIGVVTLFASQIASWFSAKTSQITSV